MSGQQSSLGSFWFAFLACTLVPAVVQAQESAAIPSLSASQMESLTDGEIIVDVGTNAAEVPMGDAIGIIEATPEEVIRVIEDFNNYEEFMEDMAHAEILTTAERAREVIEDIGSDDALEGLDIDALLTFEGEGALCFGITDTPWPMDDREWVIRAEGGLTNIDGMEVILSTFTFVPGAGNIVDIYGYWLLIPWGDDGAQTLARYHLEVDLGTWLPDFLLEWSTENFLPLKVQGIRDRLGV